jgi:hypothetical protein
MTMRSAKTTIRISMMNVVHDLSVLVARDAGLFREEGLDVDVIATAGTARANPVGEALHAKIFDRSLESLYNGGGLDQYRMCEWGVMKRTVEAVQSDQRPAKIVALGAAMTRMALVTFPASGIYEPEQLKDRPIAVSPYNQQPAPWCGFLSCASPHTVDTLRRHRQAARLPVPALLLYPS